MKTEAKRFPASFSRNDTGKSGNPSHCSRNSTGQADLWPKKKGDKQSMPLLQLVMVLIVVGVLLWLVNRFVPMQGTIKSILNAVVVIAVVLWLLNVFGLFHSFSNIRVGS